MDFRNTSQIPSIAFSIAAKATVHALHVLPLIALRFSLLAPVLLVALPARGLRKASIPKRNKKTNRSAIME